MKRMQLTLVLALVATLGSAASKDRGTLIRQATLYAGSSANSNNLGHLDRGVDLTVLERSGAQSPDSNVPWVKVAARIGGNQGEPMRELTGWLPGGPVVAESTQNGAEIVYGEAVNSEHQAEQRGGRKGAAEDAMRLYQRVAELFPGSQLAGESAWRSADIRWQIEKGRGKTPVDDSFMKAVVQKFPGSKWADLAAYEMIDNQLCADWKGLATCPQNEAQIYESYAREHPRSPKAAEALYKAAWRYGVVADIFRINGDKAQSSAAHQKALSVAHEVLDQFARTDWKPRAMDLIYKLDQNIPLYGGGVE
ncbi:MAG TPA: hypothetical protein VLT16_08700 [Candidatus Limnocylindrales bacterium]|nr:hypothetical protein [Candidatus Limnocylindrales bacterium]